MYYLNSQINKKLIDKSKLLRFAYHYHYRKFISILVIIKNFYHYIFQLFLSLTIVKSDSISIDIRNEIDNNFYTRYTITLRKTD